MNQRQYVSQKSVKHDDVNHLTPAEQDQFIAQVRDAMVRDMRQRVMDTRPVDDLINFWETGPHQDPLQGRIYVHNIAAWFDLDAMPADAPFRRDAVQASTTAGTGEAPK